MYQELHQKRARARAQLRKAILAAGQLGVARTDIIAASTLARRTVERMLPRARGSGPLSGQVAGLDQVIVAAGAAYQEVVKARAGALAQLRGSILVADKLGVERRTITQASTAAVQTVYDMFGRPG